MRFGLVWFSVNSWVVPYAFAAADSCLGQIEPELFIQGDWKKEAWNVTMGYYINCLEYHYWILCLVMLINKVRGLSCDKCTYIHTWISTVIVSLRASSAGIFVSPQFHRFMFMWSGIIQWLSIPWELGAHVDWLRGVYRQRLISQ